MTIMITGSGTAGHYYPALATACELRELGHEVGFVGSHRGMESGLHRDAGFAFHVLPSSPFYRRRWFGKLRAMADFLRCVIVARRLLRRECPGLVLGFGGHVSAAVILAAKSLGIRTAIFEANARPGLANRMVSRWVDRIYIGMFDPAGLPKACGIQTGLPLREQFLGVATAAPTAPKRLLVLGGSEGCAFLNRHMASIVQELHRAGGAVRSVTHVSGREHQARTERSYRGVGVPALVVGYTDNPSVLIEAADLVVCTAGAGVLAEICAYGKPALLVPLANAAGNHQQANAEQFLELTGCRWLEEREANLPGLALRLQEMFHAAEHGADTGRRMQSIAQPNAARVLAQHIISQLAA